MIFKEQFKGFAPRLEPPVGILEAEDPFIQRGLQ
jgi:hypothetical protein